MYFFQFNYYYKSNTGYLNKNSSQILRVHLIYTRNIKITSTAKIVHTFRNVHTSLCS